MFVAIVPPDDVVDELERGVAPHRESGGDLRWPKPENWHITCVFTADVDRDLVDELGDNLTVVASRRRAFDVTVTGGGCFPDVHAARVLWLGVTQGANDLMRLARAGRTAAARTGIRVDKADFFPHLTLARAGRPLEATSWLRILDAFPALSWRVDSFALLESQLRPDGSRYRTVANFDLPADWSHRSQSR